MGMNLGSLNGSGHWFAIGGVPFNATFYKCWCCHGSVVVINRFQIRFGEIPPAKASEEAGI
jgi:hypothetical protein